MSKPTDLDIMQDPFNLNRFVEAQMSSYHRALLEIRKGKKESHWMWYIFPQLRGLGYSRTAMHYGISGIDEARAFLAHEILGPRLISISQALLDLEGSTAHDIFGTPDDLKLQSCTTLFDQVSRSDSVFKRVLEKYFHGKLDQRTCEMINAF